MKYITKGIGRKYKRKKFFSYDELLELFKKLNKKLGIYRGGYKYYPGTVLWMPDLKTGFERLSFLEFINFYNIFYNLEGLCFC